MEEFVLAGVGRGDFINCGGFAGDTRREVAGVDGAGEKSVAWADTWFGGNSEVSFVWTFVADTNDFGFLPESRLARLGVERGSDGLLVDLRCVIVFQPLLSFSRGLCLALRVTSLGLAVDELPFSDF